MWVWVVPTDLGVIDIGLYGIAGYAFGFLVRSFVPSVGWLGSYFFCFCSGEPPVSVPKLRTNQT